MNQINYILIIFSILFIVERKAINILISYIGIIISLTLIIYKTLENIEGDYFSYILILVQVSALTILFGFIIMLFPSLSISNKIIPSTFSNEGFLKSIFSGLIIISGILLYNKYSINMGNMTYYIKSFYNNDLLHYDTSFIRKLGINLYSVDTYIIKLLLITIILLFAIIALFFLIYN